MYDALSFPLMARQREGMLTHTIQESRNVEELSIACNVRQKDFGKTASLVVCQRLLGARVETCNVWVRVLSITQSAHGSRKAQVDKAIGLTVAFIASPELVGEISKSVTHDRVVRHCSPAWDVSQIPTLSSKELLVVIVSNRDLRAAAYVTRHHYRPDDVHDIEAVNRP